ncbi:4-alpha-L-fucosyltransferase [Pseudoalteromonas sp. BMB]|uniref:TDP-N-acetylfucosamine:lipid II N-acetylfucosaminyltransferase n=1 Tax=Pseudoalteromonas sp. BMB TaxID=1874619 RepID=UPI00083D12F6|nr:TDP-N-acetylfucosamine:lipid II N-acetylfucosaminyltransferase [Pseudoalteromonas sp. BMB]ODB36792.1 4-alpha-L-fucosyltransferase [Pseudoalteromonas sp. BMB]
MIIHIFADTPHHFRPMQAFFSKLSFIDQEFWVKSENDETLLQQGFKCYSNNDELFHLLNALPDNARVTFHGVFDIHTWKRLLLHPITAKSNCVLWGAEIYRHQKPGRNIKERLARVIHSALLFRFNRVFALNQGDAELTSKLLFRRNVEVLPYPLIGMKVQETKVNPVIQILIGNSAAASNRHNFIIDMLSKFKAVDFEVIACLNYGGEQSYIDDVVRHGHNTFGSRFKPITKMLAKSEYDQLLNTVDATIFAQERQQGLYVAYAMFLMAKPMFLLESTSSYKDLSALGFELQSTNQLGNMSEEQFDISVKSKSAKNQQLMNEYFTEEALLPRWQKQLSE